MKNAELAARYAVALRLDLSTMSVRFLVGIAPTRCSPRSIPVVSRHGATIAPRTRGLVDSPGVRERRRPNDGLSYSNVAALTIVLTHPLPSTGARSKQLSKESRG